MNKKLIYIVGFVIIILIVVIIALVIKNKSSRNQIPQTQLFTAQKINNLKALNPTPSLDNTKLVYYDLDKLDLYELNLNSNETTRLSENMDQPIKIIWSPDKTQVIIKIIYDKYKFEKFSSPFVNSSLQDQTSTLWHYNLKTKKYTLLDINIFNPAPLDPLNPVWTSDSKHIIYHYLDRANKISALNIADPNGQNWRKLGDVPEEMYSILDYNESDNTVFYNTYSTESNLYNIYKFSITNQQKEEIAVDTNATLPIPSRQIIYADNKKAYILNLDSGAKKELPLMVTEDRMAFVKNNQIVITQEENNKEHFYLLNLETQKVEKNIDSGLELGDIQDIQLNSNANILYFTQNSFLYKMDLKKDE